MRPILISAGRPRFRGLVGWGGHDPGVPLTARPADLLAESVARFGSYPATEFTYGHVWPSAARTRQMGERGVELSGGQRQRLAIARELFKQPNILILDEATSSLDSQSETYIQQSIERLSGSLTIIIISHRLSTIKGIDYVYVIEQGRIIEQGTFAELSCLQGSAFRRMCELQRVVS